MGVRILTDGDNAVLYCSTSDWAFGPVFSADTHGRDAAYMAQRFLDWLAPDPREIGDELLANKYVQFLDWSENHFTKKDYDEGLETPLCLKSRAYDLMAEEPIDTDDYRDREWEYIESILEDEPWEIKQKEVAA